MKSVALLSRTKPRKNVELGLAKPKEEEKEEEEPCHEVFADIADRDLANRLHCEVIGTYHDAVIKHTTPIVITRNMTFISIILVGLQLIFNFYTELNNIYLLMIVTLSLAFIYFQVKYMAIAVIYLSLFYPSRSSSSSIKGKQHTTNKWFLFFLLVKVVTVITYVSFSYNCVYTAYFNTINSTHSVATIDAYIMIVITTVVLVAIVVVTYAFDKYADRIIENTIQEGKRKKSLLLRKQQ